MSSYRCVVLLLVACMAAVCMDGGEAVNVRQIVNVGDSYTFRCNVVSNYNHYWSRSGSYISYLIGASVSKYSKFPHSERVRSSYSNGRFLLTVLNMTVADSGTYECKYYNTYNQIPLVDVARYNAHVVGCSCTVDQPYDLRSSSKTVTCILDNYPPPSFGPVQTTITSDSQMSGTIQDNELTFSTNNDLREDLTITFNPFTNVEGRISCIVPTVPFTATTTQRTTPSMSTSVTSSTEEPPTPPSTSYLPTRGYNCTSSQYPATVSQPYFSKEPFPNITKDAGTSKKACTGTTTTSLIVVESVMGLMLIVNVIISIRLCQKLKRAPTKSSPSRLESRKEQVEVEETDMCYASIPDTNQPAVYTNA